MFCKQNAYTQSLAYSGVLQRIHSKAGSTAWKPISKQDYLQPFFDCEFSDVHSSRIAQNIERCIKSTRKHRKETKFFIEAIRNRIYFLHKYNLKVAEVTFKYPLTPNLTQLLLRYVILECSILYKKEYHTPRYEAVVEERVSKVLHSIYSSYFESLDDVPPDKLLTKRCSAILNLFIKIKTEFDVHNDLMENMAKKLLSKMGRLEHVNALKEKRIPCPLDTYLTDPALANSYKNIITSDYGTDDNLKNDEEFVQVDAQIELDDSPRNEDVKQEIDEVLRVSNRSITSDGTPKRVPTIYIDDDGDEVVIMEEEMRTSDKFATRQQIEKEKQVELRERQRELFCNHRPLWLDEKPYVKDEVVDLNSDDESSLSRNCGNERRVSDEVIVIDEDENVATTASQKLNVEEVLELGSDEDDSPRVKLIEAEELLQDKSGGNLKIVSKSGENFEDQHDSCLSSTDTAISDDLSPVSTPISEEVCKKLQEVHTNESINVENSTAEDNTEKTGDTTSSGQNSSDINKTLLSVNNQDETVSNEVCNAEKIVETLNKTVKTYKEHVGVQCTENIEYLSSKTELLNDPIKDKPSKDVRVEEKSAEKSILGVIEDKTCETIVGACIESDETLETPVEKQKEPLPSTETVSKTPEIDLNSLSNENDQRELPKVTPEENSGVQEEKLEDSNEESTNQYSEKVIQENFSTVIEEHVLNEKTPLNVQPEEEIGDKTIDAVEKDEFSHGVTQEDDQNAINHSLEPENACSKAVVQTSTNEIVTSNVTEVLNSTDDSFSSIVTCNNTEIETDIPFSNKNNSDLNVPNIKVSSAEFSGEKSVSSEEEESLIKVLRETEAIEVTKVPKELKETDNDEQKCENRDESESFSSPLRNAEEIGLHNENRKESNVEKGEIEHFEKSLEESIETPSDILQNEPLKESESVPDSEIKDMTVQNVITEEPLEELEEENLVEPLHEVEIENKATEGEKEGEETKVKYFKGQNFSEIKEIGPREPQENTETTDENIKVYKIKDASEETLSSESNENPDETTQEKTGIETQEMLHFENEEVETIIEGTEEIIETQEVLHFENAEQNTVEVTTESVDNSAPCENIDKDVITVTELSECPENYICHDLDVSHFEEIKTITTHASDEICYEQLLPEHELELTVQEEEVVTETATLVAVSEETTTLIPTNEENHLQSQVEEHLTVKQVQHLEICEVPSENTPLDLLATVASEVSRQDFFVTKKKKRRTQTETKNHKHVTLKTKVKTVQEKRTPKRRSKQVSNNVDKRVTRSAQIKQVQLEPKCKPHDFFINNSRVPPPANNIYTQKMPDVNVTSEDSNDSEGILLIDEDIDVKSTKSAKGIPETSPEEVLPPNTKLTCYDEDTMEENIVFRYEPKVKGTVLISIPDTQENYEFLNQIEHLDKYCSDYSENKDSAKENGENDVDNVTKTDFSGILSLKSDQSVNKQGHKPQRTSKPFRTKAEQKDYDKFSLTPYVSIKKLKMPSREEKCEASVEKDETQTENLEKPDGNVESDKQSSTEPEDPKTTTEEIKEPELLHKIDNFPPKAVVQSDKAETAKENYDSSDDMPLSKRTQLNHKQTGKPKDKPLSKLNKEKPLRKTEPNRVVKENGIDKPSTRSRKNKNDVKETKDTSKKVALLETTSLPDTVSSTPTESSVTCVESSVPSTDSAVKEVVTTILETAQEVSVKSSENQCLSPSNTQKQYEEYMKNSNTKYYTTPKLRRKSVTQQNLNRKEKSSDTKQEGTKQFADKKYYSTPKLRRKSGVDTEVNSIDPEKVTSKEIKLPTSKIEILSKCKNTISPTTEKLKRKLATDLKLNSDSSEILLTEAVDVRISDLEETALIPKNIFKNSSKDTSLSTSENQDDVDKTGFKSVVKGGTNGLVKPLVVEEIPCFTSSVTEVPKPTQLQILQMQESTNIKDQNMSEMLPKIQNETDLKTDEIETISNSKLESTEGSSIGNENDLDNLPLLKRITIYQNLISTECKTSKKPQMKKTKKPVASTETSTEINNTHIEPQNKSVEDKTCINNVKTVETKTESVKKSADTVKSSKNNLEKIPKQNIAKEDDKTTNESTNLKDKTGKVEQNKQQTTMLVDEITDKNIAKENSIKKRRKSKTKIVEDNAVIESKTKAANDEQSDGRLKESKPEEIKDTLMKEKKEQLEDTTNVEKKSVVKAKELKRNNKKLVKDPDTHPVNNKTEHSIPASIEEVSSVKNKSLKRLKKSPENQLSKAVDFDLNVTKEKSEQSKENHSEVKISSKNKVGLFRNKLLPKDKDVKKYDLLQKVNKRFKKFMKKSDLLKSWKNKKLVSEWKKSETNTKLSEENKINTSVIATNNFKEKQKSSETCMTNETDDVKTNVEELDTQLDVNKPLQISETSKLSDVSVEMPFVSKICPAAEENEVKQLGTESHMPKTQNETDDSVKQQTDSCTVTIPLEKVSEIEIMLNKLDTKKNSDDLKNKTEERILENDQSCIAEVEDSKEVTKNEGNQDKIDDDLCQPISEEEKDKTLSTVRDEEMKLDEKNKNLSPLLTQIEEPIETNLNHTVTTDKNDKGDIIEEITNNSHTETDKMVSKDLIEVNDVHDVTDILESDKNEEVEKIAATETDKIVPEDIVEAENTSNEFPEDKVEKNEEMEKISHTEVDEIAPKDVVSIQIVPDEIVEDKGDKNEEMEKILHTEVNNIVPEDIISIKNVPDGTTEGEGDQNEEMEKILHVEVDEIIPKDVVSVKIIPEEIVKDNSDQNEEIEEISHAEVDEIVPKDVVSVKTIPEEIVKDNSDQNEEIEEISHAEVDEIVPKDVVSVKIIPDEIVKDNSDQNEEIEKISHAEVDEIVPKDLVSVKTIPEEIVKDNSDQNEEIEEISHAEVDEIVPKDVGVKIVPDEIVKDKGDKNEEMEKILHTEVDNIIPEDITSVKNVPDGIAEDKGDKNEEMEKLLHTEAEKIIPEEIISAKNIQDGIAEDKSDQNKKTETISHSEVYKVVTEDIGVTNAMIKSATEQTQVESTLMLNQENAEIVSEHNKSEEFKENDSIAITKIENKDFKENQISPECVETDAPQSKSLLTSKKRTENSSDKNDINEEKIPQDSTPIKSDVVKKDILITPSTLSNRKRKQSTDKGKMSNGKKSKLSEIKIDVTSVEVQCMNNKNSKLPSPSSVSPRKKEKKSIECIINQLKEEKISSTETKEKVINHTEINEEKIRSTEMVEEKISTTETVEKKISSAESKEESSNSELSSIINVDVGTLKKKLLQKIKNQNSLKQETENKEQTDIVPKEFEQPLPKSDIIVKENEKKIENVVTNDNIEENSNSVENTVTEVHPDELMCGVIEIEFENKSSNMEIVEEVPIPEPENPKKIDVASRQDIIQELKKTESEQATNNNVDVPMENENTTEKSVQSSVAKNVDTDITDLFINNVSNSVEISTLEIQDNEKFEPEHQMFEHESLNDKEIKNSVKKINIESSQIVEPKESVILPQNILEMSTNNELISFENKSNEITCIEETLEMVDPSSIECKTSELPLIPEIISDSVPLNITEETKIPIPNELNLVPSPLVQNPTENFPTGQIEVPIENPTKKSIAETINTCVEEFNTGNVTAANLLNLSDLMLHVSGVGNVSHGIEECVTSEAVCMLSDIISTTISSTVTTQAGIKNQFIPITESEKQLGGSGSRNLTSPTISLNLRDVQFPKSFDLISQAPIMPTTSDRDFMNEMPVDGEMSDIVESRCSNATDHNYTLESLGGPLLSGRPEEEHIFTATFDKNLVDSPGEFALNDNELPSEMSESDDTYKLNLDNEYAVKNLVMLGGQTSVVNSFSLSNYNLPDIKRINLIEDNISNSEENGDSLDASIGPGSKDIPGETNPWDQFIADQNPSENLTNVSEQCLTSSFSNQSGSGFNENDLLKTNGEVETTDLNTENLTMLDGQTSVVNAFPLSNYNLSDIKEMNLIEDGTENIPKTVTNPWEFVTEPHPATAPKEQCLKSPFSIPQADLVQSVVLTTPALEGEALEVRNGAVKTAAVDLKDVPNDTNPWAQFIANENLYQKVVVLQNEPYLASSYSLGQNEFVDPCVLSGPSFEADILLTEWPETVVRTEPTEPVVKQEPKCVNKEKLNVKNEPSKSGTVKLDLKKEKKPKSVPNKVKLDDFLPKKTHSRTPVRAPPPKNAPNSTSNSKKLAVKPQNGAIESNLECNTKSSKETLPVVAPLTVPQTPPNTSKNKVEVPQTKSPVQNLLPDSIEKKSTSPKQPEVTPVSKNLPNLTTKTELAQKQPDVHCNIADLVKSRKRTAANKYSSSYTPPTKELKLDTPQFKKIEKLSSTRTRSTTPEVVPQDRKTPQRDQKSPNIKLGVTKLPDHEIKSSVKDKPEDKPVQPSVTTDDKSKPRLNNAMPELCQNGSTKYNYSIESILNKTPESNVKDHRPAKSQAVKRPLPTLKPEEVPQKLKKAEPSEPREIEKKINETFDNLVQQGNVNELILLRVTKDNKLKTERKYSPSSGDNRSKSERRSSPLVKQAALEPKQKSERSVLIEKPSRSVRDPGETSGRETDRRRDDRRNSPLPKADGKTKQHSEHAKRDRNSFYLIYNRPRESSSSRAKTREDPAYTSASLRNPKPREWHHSDSNRRREAYYSEHVRSREGNHSGYSATRDGHHSDHSRGREHHPAHTSGTPSQSASSSHATGRSSNVSRSYYKTTSSQGEDQSSHSGSRHGSHPYTKRGTMLSQEKQNELLNALRDMVHEQLNSSGFNKSTAEEDYSWLDKFNQFGELPQFIHSSPPNERK